MPDIRQSFQYAEYLSGIGWYVENVSGVYYFIKKIPVLGSILKAQRPEKIDTRTISMLAKKYRSFQIIVEPKDNSQLKSLKTDSFKPTNNHYLPTKTLVLDIRETKEKLLLSFKKDTRYALRKTLNLDNKIKEVNENEILKFRMEWRRAVGLKRYVPPLSHLIRLKKVFGNNCLFLLTIGSGAIFLRSKNKGYYWQAFTDRLARKKLVQYRIVWQGILWAKQKGVNIFDFEGIYDSRFPDRSWLGFSHFKKSFSGSEITYPGAYTKFTILLFK